MIAMRQGPPRMTLPRALRSELARLARSPLAVAHLACGLAGGLACGAYFSVAPWNPVMGTDAYAQFLGALMPLMSGIACGLAVDAEREAGGLTNLTALPSRGRAVLAKWLALSLMGAGALALAISVFGAMLAAVGRLPLGPAPLALSWAGATLGSLPLYALGLAVVEGFAGHPGHARAHLALRQSDQQRRLGQAVAGADGVGRQAELLEVGAELAGRLLGDRLGTDDEAVDVGQVQVGAILRHGEAVG